MTTSTTPPHLRDLLTRVQQFAQAQQITLYLVGGFVRDLLLGRSTAIRNVDFTIAQDAPGVAKALAEHLRGAFVPLDEAWGTARVVVSHSAGVESASLPRVELDLSTFRGPTLEEDLRRRDFTINAMAIRLEDWLRHPDDPTPLIDPLRGREALARRCLTACFDRTFEEDPLRIVRAFRLAVQLDCELGSGLEPLMKASAQQLTRVAGERVRDELLAVLTSDRAYWAVQRMNAFGVLDVLIPELSAGRDMDQGGYHHLDVLNHQLETVQQGDRMMADCSEFSEPLRQPLAAYCAETLVEGRSRKSLIKLGGLLHDIGKPARRTVEADGEIWFRGHEQTGAEIATHVTQRLQLANREAQLVHQVVLHHLRPGFLSREPQLTRRAIYRFFKDLGENGPACLLTWWMDRMSTRGPRSNLAQVDQQRARLEELLSAYFFKADEVVKPPRMVDGHQLMRELRLAPGPIIGELLEAIEEGQAEGCIASAEQAMALARERLRVSSQS